MSDAGPVCGIAGESVDSLLLCHCCRASTLPPLRVGWLLWRRWRRCAYARFRSRSCRPGQAKWGELRVTGDRVSGVWCDRNKRKSGKLKIKQSINGQRRLCEAGARINWARGSRASRVLASARRTWKWRTQQRCTGLRELKVGLPWRRLSSPLITVAVAAPPSSSSPSPQDPPTHRPRRTE